MHEQDKSFIRQLKSFVRHGCDVSPGRGTTDPQQRVLPLSEEEFLHGMYEERDVEVALHRAIASTPALTCLVGAQGSGKTSIGRKIRNDLISRAGDDFYPVYIDLRIETEAQTICIDTFRSFDRTLRDRLANQYFSELFQFTRKGENPRIDLWAFLFQEKNETLKPMEIFSVFTKYQDEVAKLLRIHDLGHEDEIDIKEWLIKTINEAGVNKLTSEMDKIICLSHLVYAARHVKSIKRQLIWLDNVDALDDKHQNQLIRIARSIFQPLSTYASIVVAVREENIFREDDLWDEGAPPFEVRVLLEVPRGAGGFAYYPAHDIPVAPDKKLKQIVKKRLNAAKIFQNKYSQNRTTIESEGVDSYWSEFVKPAISDQRYGYICSLAEILTEAMNVERAIYLVNNSMRDYLLVFRDCLADLLKAGNDFNGRPRALDYQPWYVRTFFLKLIRHSQRRYRIGVYDVVAAADKWHSSGKSKIGCLLPYLIITTVWNITISRQQETGAFGPCPEVGEVVKTLELIGYERPEIVENLHALYFWNNRRNNLIEFRKKTIINSPDEITDDIKTYVTFRGKCLASRTGSSFGYLFDCVRLLSERQSEAAASDLPEISDPDGAMESILPYLCDIAEMHYSTLHNIRTKEYLGKKGWLAEYYRKFGVPIVRPYRESGSGGRVIDGRRKFLQLECILDGLSRYNAIKKKDGIIKLHSEYIKDINELDSDKVPSNHVGFRSRLGIPDRV